MLLLLLLLLAARHTPCAVAAVAAPATVTRGVEPMRLSSTGPANTLPSFFFMAGAEEGGSLWGGDFAYRGGRGDPDPFDLPVQNCPDEFYANQSPDLRVPQLPWRLQNDWGCERTPDSKVPVVVLENAYLRAAITPQWGSKIWSLYHKKEKRQLIYNNPAHQPNNIGYRKAWTSGGAEWNWAPGKIGHSVFSESDSFLAVLDTERGPVVRAWEYDRQNHTVWSVDMFLDGETLWAHPRIYNYGSGGKEVPGYWWTCVAMRTTDGTRIVSPASLSVSPCTPWPHGAWTLDNTTFRGQTGLQGGGGGPDACAATSTCAYQNDNSYIGNIPSSHDFFFYIPKNVTPHVTHVTKDGWSFVHSHAPEIRGTKFFQWGQHMMGQFQQDFMSGSDYQNPKCNPDYYDPWCEHYVHEGDYTELQVGPAPTQMHTFPVPGNSTYEWTENFRGFHANVSRVHASDYAEAQAEVAEWIASPDGLPQDMFQDVDAFLRGLATVAPKPEDIMHQGMPWGGLREKLLAAEAADNNGVPSRSSSPPPRLVPHGACPFPDPPRTVETAPWLDLLGPTGTFSPETLAVTPVNFEIDKIWMRRVADSMAVHGATWLHHLFLGTEQLEVGNVAAAEASFKASLALQPNAHAYRNLATTATTADAGAKLYAEAWAAWKKLDPKADPSSVLLGKDLASEISVWLMLNARWEPLRAFLADLPAAYTRKDRVLHATAALAVNVDKNWTAALDILESECFPTYGNKRSALIELRWQAKLGQAQDASPGGRPLTTLELVKLRRKLGCDGDSTTSGVRSPCTRGSPNLGLRY